MKAALFYGPPGSWPDSPLKLEEVPIPRPGPGEVLLRVAACGMCRTDLDYLHGGMKPLKDFPVILGHEPSGVVETVGEGVEGFHKGDRVLVSYTITCGQCPPCRSGRENLCLNSGIVGSSRDGAFAEYMTIPAKNLCPLPQGLPLEESAIITDAVATNYHALVEVAQVRPGDVVVVYGASGGLGLTAVQMATSLGATVVGVGRKRWKLEKAREMGAVAVVSTEEVAKVEDEINRITGGGADISVDTSGIGSLVETAIKSTRPGGKIVIVGFSLERVSFRINRLVWLEHAILGCRTYRPIDLRRAVMAAEKGMVDVTRLVSHRFRLKEINQAYQMLLQGDLLRGLIIP